jgi:hypothetical protein
MIKMMNLPKKIFIVQDVLQDQELPSLNKLPVEAFEAELPIQTLGRMIQIRRDAWQDLDKGKMNLRTIPLVRGEIHARIKDVAVAHRLMNKLPVEGEIWMSPQIGHLIKVVEDMRHLVDLAGLRGHLFVTKLKMLLSHLQERDHLVQKILIDQL